METFQITDEVCGIFRSDLSRFRNETHRALERLLAQPDIMVGIGALEEVARHAHTLKGLASMVVAEGLASWGGDLERLFEIAGSFLQSARERTLEIARFVCGQMRTWSEMNELTLANDYAAAHALYVPLREAMEARWGEYFTMGPEEDEDCLSAEFEHAEPVSPEGEKQRITVEGVSRPSVLAPVLLRRDTEGKIEPSRQAEVVPTSLATLRVLGGQGAALPGIVPPMLMRKNSAPVLATAPAVVAANTMEEVARAGEMLGHHPARKQRRKSAVEAKYEKTEAEGGKEPLKNALIDAKILNVKTPTSDLEMPTGGMEVRTGILDAQTGILEVRTGIPEVRTGILDARTGTLEDVVQSSDLSEPLKDADRFPIDATARLLHPSGNGDRGMDKPALSVFEGSDTDLPTLEDDGIDLLAMLQEESAGYLALLAPLLAGLALQPDSIVAWEECRRLFHTLKGSAATVGVEGVASAAKRGEARCLVAAESTKDRDRESVEVCVARAAEVAAHLGLPFALNVGSLPIAAPVVVAECEALPDAELLSFFTVEVAENARCVEAAVLCWERGEAPAEQIAAALRAFHTIKGAANSIGLARLGACVHEAESAMAHAAAGNLAGTPELFALLLRAVDQLRAYGRSLEGSAPGAWVHDWAGAFAALQPAASVPLAVPAMVFAEAAPVEDERQLLRVENDRLHRLFDLVGEMVTDRSRLQKNIARIRDLEAQLTERNQSLAATVVNFQQQFEFNLLRDRNTAPRGSAEGSGTASSEFSELEFDRYDQFSILSRSLVELAHDIETVLSDVGATVETFGADDVRFTQTSRLLQQEITGLGMVPFSALYPRLQRAFRDAAHSVGKKADLVFEGAGVQVDKVLTDRIYSPLLHLLRNAVAHGIEDAGTREALGKPARGQVRLATVQSASQIILTLSDDGGGLDLGAIRTRAIERGLLAAEAGAITTAQALEIIFQHGFSTATAITSVAGRGVGMDVVRQEIESLNGAIQYTANEGEGATWTLRLPLSVSISEAIIAECAGQEMAFPLNFVESGTILETSPTLDASGAETYLHQGHALPVVRLRELLRLPGEHAPTRGIIVAVGGRRAIFLLDRVIARREVVVKNLDVLLRQHPLLTGATLDTEGRVLPILNVPALLTYHDSPASRRPAPASGPRRVVARSSSASRVLIVDDSLSVRKVQERLLTSLGCEVVAAHDGLDALEKLREGRFDLIFTDLEMPRMNGYELIAELRANPAWAGLPVAVISSRGADKYINKAMALGANTFLSKPFTEAQLSSILNHYAGWGATAAT